MAIQICTVSGILRNPSGAGLQGVMIKASMNRPFIHPSDSSLITNYEVETTSDATGAWSLDLVETETALVTITISFYYSLAAASSTERRDYAVTIPNLASAAFASLIDATAGTQV